MLDVILILTSIAGFYLFDRFTAACGRI